jgi:hypothetical protein
MLGGQYHEAQISQILPASSDHHLDHHLPLFELVRASPCWFPSRPYLQRRTRGNDQGPAADVWGSRGRRIKSCQPGRCNSRSEAVSSEKAAPTLRSLPPPEPQRAWAPQRVTSAAPRQAGHDSVAPGTLRLPHESALRRVVLIGALGPPIWPDRRGVLAIFVESWTLLAKDVHLAE